MPIPVRAKRGPASNGKPLHLIPWSARFEDPIALTNGRALETLRDCCAVHHQATQGGTRCPEWQAAMEALLLVAELGGPTMFARIGVMRALNRHLERQFSPDRKDPHWGRRKLARDRC
jgi:hypothetical protein